MGTGSSKRTAQVVTTHEKLNGNHTTIKNTSSNAKDTEEYNSKLSQNAETQNENVKDKSKATIREGKPEAVKSSTDEEGTRQNVDGETTLLLTSFCENNPQLEPRLSATNKHYQALREALHSGNLMTAASLEHAKALIDVYSKCRKRSNKTVVTDFAVAVGIPKLVYEIIVDRRSNYPEITTWDRKPRKDTEQEQGTQEEENDDSQEGDDNQVMKADRWTIFFVNTNSRFKMSDQE